MLTPQKAMEEMKHYSLTAAVVCLGADNLSEAEFSHWIRGKREFAPEVLHRIEVSLGALANLAHDSIPWPLSFRSPALVPLIRRYVEQHKLYLREKAEHDAREAAASEG